MTNAMQEPVPPRPDIERAADQPPPATWKAIEALPVGLIALGVTAVVGAVAAAVSPGAITRGPGGSIEQSPAFFTIASFLQEGTLLVTVLLWVRLVNRGSPASLGVPPRRPWVDLLVGAVAGVALVFAAGIVLAAVHWVARVTVGHEVSNPDQVPTTVKGAYLALTGIVVVGLAPLAEETFFRGFLYKALRRRWAPWPSAVLSAAFFGLAHFAGLDFLLIIPSLIVVGVILALVYEHQHSLLASVAAHATFNLIGFLFIAFGR